MTKRNPFTRIDVLIVSLILLLALSLRLYKINSPVADWHSWRQADTAAVARNFVEKDFNMFMPKYDDYSNVQTGQYNPEGLRLVEFPIYNASFALVYKYLPVVSLEVMGRLVSIFSSLIVIFVMYYLLVKESSRIAAITGSLIYAIFPFFVYYSRVILPEPSALATIFLGIFFLYQWVDTKNRPLKILYFCLSVVSTASALLIKPPVVFYFIPLGYLFLRHYRLRAFIAWPVYLYFAIAFGPTLAWRWWIQHFPVGIAAYEWLITTVQTYQGPQVIFMRPAFFRWVFYERILLLIMGGWAGVFVYLGVVKRQALSHYLFYSIGVGALAYLLVFQGGNVQHDYYQTMILPALAIFTGIGISTLYDSKKLFANPIFVTFTLIGILTFSWLLSYDTVKNYYNYSEDLVQTAKIIDTLTPKDALIITDTTGDTTLLYNAHRAGMPAVSAPLPDLKNRGMQYFVTQSSDVASKVSEEYKDSFQLVFKNNNVYIFKLSL